MPIGPTSGDAATVAALRRNRDRRAALTTLLSVFSRGMSLAVVFVSLRIALPYLGEARFGVWMTIASLTTVLMVFDLGIGNGMVSRVAGLVAQSDWVGLRRLVSTGLGLLSLIGLLIGGALASAAAWLPIAWLYKGASAAVIVEARGALMWLGVLFGLSIPLQAVHRVYAGLQQGYLSMAITGVAGLVSIVTIVFLPQLHAGITGFLLATYGLQLSCGFVLLIALTRRFGLSLPRVADARQDVRAVMSSGGLFFLLQIAGVIGWDMDAMLLSVFVGPAAVALYSVVQRMFLLVTGPLSMLNAPLWASYADAHARGDTHYIRKTFYRSVLGTFGLAIAGVAVILTARAPLWHVLTKDATQPPVVFVLLFGAWTLVSATGDALAMYLNGLQILVPQVVACIAFVTVALVMKIALVQSYGLTGVIFGTLASYLLTTVLLFSTVFRKRISAALRVAPQLSPQERGAL